MPNPLQMYVNADEDGGGYDFYPINGSGRNINYHGQYHSGADLGLDMLYGDLSMHGEQQQTMLQ